jgi:tetratricopeptide (TPR) repeat protein
MNKNCGIIWMLLLLSVILTAQSMDALQGIQRRDTSDNLIPLDLDQIPDQINESEFVSEPRIQSNVSLQAVIDSMEYIFNLEKERLEANFKTSYEYRLNRAVDSIRLSVADKISTLQNEINELRNLGSEGPAIVVDENIVFQRDSLATELEKLRKTMEKLSGEIITGYTYDEILQERLHYQYLLKLMDQKEAGSFFLRKTNELSDLKKRELNLYLDKYLPDMNSGEILIRLARVYEDQKDGHAAKLIYLKYLFYFPHSTNMSYIKEQILKLTDAYQSPRDSLLLSYLPDEYRASLPGSPRFKYIHALIDMGYPEGLAFTDTEIRQYLKETEPDEFGDLAILWYSDILRDRGLYTTALWQKEKIIAVYPDSPHIPKAIMDAASIYRRDLKDSKSALEKLQSLVEKYPDHELTPEALIIRGDIFETDQKDKIAALAEYEKIISNYKSTNQAITALNNMGRIYQTLSKNPDLALKQYERIKSDYPGFRSDAAQAMIKIAGIYENQGEFSKAVKESEELHTLYPEFKDVPAQLIKAAVMAEKKMGKADKAMELYELIITQYPETSESANAKKALAKLQKKTE